MFCVNSPHIFWRKFTRTTAIDFPDFFHCHQPWSMIMLYRVCKFTTGTIAMWEVIRPFDIYLLYDALYHIMGRACHSSVGLRLFPPVVGPPWRSSCWWSASSCCHSPRVLLVNCRIPPPLFPSTTVTLTLTAVCGAVCSEESSPPRFVGHLSLLLLARLTFAVHSQEHSHLKSLET